MQFHQPAAEDLQAYFWALREDQTMHVNVCEEAPADWVLEGSGSERAVIVVDAREQPDNGQPESAGAPSSRWQQ